MPQPTCSVVIITHNRAGYLSQAVQSVLAQTFTDFELLIIDDASTDNTAQVVRSFADARIRYVENKNNMGISRSRNKGLHAARGMYVAMLDSDDRWCSKEKLDKQIRYLELHQEYQAVGSHARVIDQNGKVVGERNPPDTYKKIRPGFLWKNIFINSSVLFRRQTLVNAGGYDEKLIIGEDYDAWLKLGIKGSLANIPECLVDYRLHEGNVTRQSKQALRQSLIIITRYRKDYPGFTIAWLRRFFRYMIACLLLRQ